MIAVIAGTNRPGSNTLLIAKHVHRLHSQAGEECTLLDLANLPPEIFSPESYTEKPPAFASFTDPILSANGLVVVTPEYNGGMPGVLKYFIDMLPFPESFEARPVCFVGIAAGMWGALRPVEQLQQIFGYRNAHILPQRVFVPGVMNALREDGRLTDEKLAERLDTQARQFREFTTRFGNRDD